MNNYFEIENLKCAYPQKDKREERKIILEIDKLEIPRGKIVFIVGPSGCGKSTILETLGLMNNTILQNSGCEKFVFYPNENKSIDCLSIWKQNNKVLSDIRKKHFSFIFQQTNLMKNFSIKQNAILPQQIKGGKKKYEDTIKELYNEEKGQILKKLNVNELSGGQQQRLSFVRAIMPNFDILFGDEPTGNLDPENADNLMKLIVDEIHNSGGNKTAIIVSHTPELYNKYADIIITIQKKERNNGDTYGLINKESVKINSNYMFETEEQNEVKKYHKISMYRQ